MIINLSKIDFGGIATGGKSKPEEVFDVQPTTSDQTITPTEGSVFSGGTVRAVTSEIDNNIVPENIKEGVSILGVEGSHKGEKPEESFNVQPTTAEQTITPTEGSVFSRGTVRAVTSSIDDNIVSNNIREGVTILGVEGTLKEETGVFVVPPDMRFGNSTFTEVPSYLDFSNMTDMYSLFANCRSLISIPYLDTKNVTNMNSMFFYCGELTSIPPMDTSNVTNTFQLFYNCKKLVTIPPLDTSKVTNMEGMLFGCESLTTVEGIDFSGLTSPLTKLFDYSGSKTKLTRFIVNGKINVSFYDNYSFEYLTVIDYDSVKSILAAADRTDNTNAKKLAFNRTIPDQNGELKALVSSCTSKGWTITGLYIQ